MLSCDVKTIPRRINEITGKEQVDVKINNGLGYLVKMRQTEQKLCFSLLCVAVGALMEGVIEVRGQHYVTDPAKPNLVLMLMDDVSNRLTTDGHCINA